MIAINISTNMVVVYVSFSQTMHIKFHVNIITGSGVMVIFSYEGLTRNLQIGNTSISGDWGKLAIPNLVRMFLMRCYLILQNANSFYRFCVIKGKPTGLGGEGGGTTSFSTQIRG